ncbi:uncharacterized protein K489DRAFT_97873 [Dissoconium aciculare CBS 342.82]|jgi:hypothetical protein|uniref:Uncharacterized protein n=1 Tax=Dissoconium aciculare CBS 342.82 TaxID=1314786 RepID=A0A6J3MFV3_9PEZI|nr:uncharacterized protein K489DRAFT_97873 [Dissoconium aciculare CBS 342.82]KAF1825762.1 hypothetical protein K489DRAFT_97873 [Dissoconium aciculare CBS 342.82]
MRMRHSLHVTCSDEGEPRRLDLPADPLKIVAGPSFSITSPFTHTGARMYHFVLHMVITSRESTMHSMTRFPTAISS